MSYQEIDKPQIVHGKFGKLKLCLWAKNFFYVLFKLSEKFTLLFLNLGRMLSFDE
jgi:hypothetical protein